MALKWHPSAPRSGMIRLMCVDRRYPINTSAITAYESDKRRARIRDDAAVMCTVKTLSHGNYRSHLTRLLCREEGRETIQTDNTDNMNRSRNEVENECIE